VATRTNSGKIQTIEGRWVQLCREGWPDISAIINGQFVGIETKALKGKQRDSQLKTQASIEHAGGVYLLANKISVLREYLSAVIQ